MNVNKSAPSEIIWPRWPMVDQHKFESSMNKVFESQRWALSGYWTGQPSLEQQFAKSFSEFNGVPYCVPTTNGSSALLIALEALGIGIGDEVILPAMTWMAPATAVLNVNAKPILADVLDDTLCIDPEYIEQKITDKTKGIIAVHLYGSLANMDRIMEIADRYKLFVIEDCAQSHGSIWKGKRVGSIGHIGTYSFQQGKVLTSGEGGAAITSDKNIFKRLEQLRSDSRTLSADGIRLGDMELIEEGSIQGSNFCLSEFQASLLHMQLDDLDELNNQKTQNALLLSDLLNEVNGIQVMRQDKRVDRQTYYGYAFRYDHEYACGVLSEEFASHLQKELNMGSFYLHACYQPIHKNKLFCPWTKKRYDPDNAMNKDYWHSLHLPVSEAAANNTIVIHHAILHATKSQIEHIAYSVDKVLKRIRHKKRCFNS